MLSYAILYGVANVKDNLGSYGIAGRKLKRARQAVNLTQAQLADLAGTRQEVIARLESVDEAALLVALHKAAEASPEDQAELRHALGLDAIVEDTPEPPEPTVDTPDEPEALVSDSPRDAALKQALANPAAPDVQTAVRDALAKSDDAPDPIPPLPEPEPEHPALTNLW